MRISPIVVRLIQIYANNIVFTHKIRLCLHKIAISYLLSQFFMQFSHLYQIFFYVFCFPIYNNVHPKYCQCYKRDVNKWTQRLYLWEVL